MDRVGVSAVRALGVDVANLTSRLAVQMAVIENLVDMASQITPQAWESQKLDEGNDDLPEGTTLVTITEDEAQRVIALVGEILALRSQ